MSPPTVETKDDKIIVQFNYLYEVYKYDNASEILTSLNESFIIDFENIDGVFKVTNIKRPDV